MIFLLNNFAAFFIQAGIQNPTQCSTVPRFQPTERGCLCRCRRRLVYIHGNISQSDNEKDVRRTLKAKYDYQLKKLRVKPDASDARQMISAALAKLGLKPRNNSFTPLYGMPAVLAANSMKKESKKTPTVTELKKKAIAYDKSMFEDTQRSEDEFIQALSRRDDLRRLYQDEQFKKIWKSKKHDITEDMKRLARRAYLKKKKSKDSSKLAPWFCSILNKFKDYGKVDDSDTEEKKRIAKQFESISGYDADLILKCYDTKTLCFGPAQCMGHFQNILLEMEKNLFLYLMVLKKDGIPIQHEGAYGSTRSHRQRIMKKGAVVPRRANAAKADNIKVLKDTNVWKEEQILRSVEEKAFFTDHNECNRIVRMLEEDKIFDLQTERKGACIQSRRHSTMSTIDADFLVRLRDVICGKRCEKSNNLCLPCLRHEVDVHGHVYRDVRQSVYRSLRRGKTRSKTKRATKDTSDVRRTYLRPALDKAHFVHLKMHSLDNTAWARYFVTYFRQYLLTEVGSRYNQCQL